MKLDEFHCSSCLQKRQTNDGFKSQFGKKKEEKKTFIKLDSDPSRAIASEILSLQVHSTKKPQVGSENHVKSFNRKEMKP